MKAQTGNSWSGLQKTIRSIYYSLSAEFPNVDMSQYITFNALRSWGVVKDNLLTEQVYIHAKLLIIDDKVVVIGSCNINDRSMLGNRDSEIAVGVTDNIHTHSVMNGHHFEASQFALSLRLRLWRCHLGIKLDDPNHSLIQDPISPVAWDEMWRKTAQINTEIFANVFGTNIPENCTKLSQLTRSTLVKATPNNLLQLQQVNGFLINFPFTMFTGDFSVEDKTPSNLFGKIYL